jgi:hypothetical protein
MDGNYNVVSIAITNNADANTWWRVELASAHDIIKVVVCSHQGGTLDRLTGAVVSLLDSSGDVIAVGH